MPVQCREDALFVRHGIPEKRCVCFDVQGQWLAITEDRRMGMARQRRRYAQAKACQPRSLPAQEAGEVQWHGVPSEFFR